MRRAVGNNVDDDEKRKKRLSAFPKNVFSSFDNEEAPLDYGGSILHVEPSEPIQMDLDEQKTTLCLTGFTTTNL